MSDSFRTRRVYVTSAHHRLLEALANQHGLVDGPDAALEWLLQQELERQPDLLAAQRDVAKYAKERYAKLNGTGTDGSDKLP